MVQIRVVGRQLLAAAVVLLGGPVSPASAQDTPAMVTLGGRIGVINTGEPSSGGAGGRTGATRLDLRVADSRRLRIEAGLTHWTPDNEPHGEPPVRAGNVWLSHVGVTALRYADTPPPGLPRGMYLGWGVARYRYFIQRGDVGHSRSWGLHGVAGIEYFRPRSRWGFQTEASVRFVGGPQHNQVWAYTLPMTSVSAGLSRRF